MRKKKRKKNGPVDTGPPSEGDRPTLQDLARDTAAGVLSLAENFAVAVPSLDRSAEPRFGEPIGTSDAAVPLDEPSDTQVNGAFAIADVEAPELDGEIEQARELSH